MLRSATSSCGCPAGRRSGRRRTSSPAREKARGRLTISAASACASVAECNGERLTPRAAVRSGQRCVRCRVQTTGSLPAGSGTGDDVAVRDRVHHDHDRLAQLIILSKISKSTVVQCWVSEQYVGNSERGEPDGLGKRVRQDALNSLRPSTRLVTARHRIDFVASRTGESH